MTSFPLPTSAPQPPAHQPAHMHTPGPPAQQPPGLVYHAASAAHPASVAHAAPGGHVALTPAAAVAAEIAPPVPTFTYPYARAAPTAHFGNGYVSMLMGGTTTMEGLESAAAAAGVGRPGALPFPILTRPTPVPPPQPPAPPPPVARGPPEPTYKVEWITHGIPSKIQAIVPTAKLSRRRPPLTVNVVKDWILDVASVQEFEVCCPTTKVMFLTTWLCIWNPLTPENSLSWESLKFLNSELI